ncbi:MAG: 50S ribosomal protein L11 methyltransferase [Desulfurococcales archaeon]|nr:50S ribosomal protein L11 methyltransferase [Desulfurococcales archaeon]
MKDRIVPYIPSTKKVAQTALNEALAHRAKILVDLGSGDGRVLVMAAKYFGLKAIGYEIDEDLCVLAEVNARENGVDDLVEVRCESFYKADLGEADIIYAYLYSSILDTLKPLFKSAPYFSRIVVVDLFIPKWYPIRIKRLLDEAGVVRSIGVYFRGISDDLIKRSSSHIQPS